MHKDISRATHDESSIGVTLLVECISVGLGILIFLNTLNVVEEYMEGKQVVLNTIQKSSSDSLNTPAFLMCSNSMPRRKYMMNGDLLVLNARLIFRYIFTILLLILAIISNKESLNFYCFLILKKLAIIIF